MKSFGLRLAKAELLRALDVLSVTRKCRFSSVVPVWLRLNAEASELELTEDKGVAAGLPAAGSWPPAGATVNLYALRHAVMQCRGDPVELQVLEDRIVIADGNFQAHLDLLPLGPDEVGGGEGLPLFRWARRRSGPVERTD